MLGSPAGPGAASHQRGFWPLAPAPAPSANTFASDGLSRYGVYSLFPGGPGFGGALYSQSSTIGRFASGSIPPTSGAPFHTSHKESLFSTAGYTFGAPTPPPGSPYSPVTSSQLELFAKGYNSNIIIQQPSDFTLSPKKGQLPEKSRPEDSCLKIKPEKSACGCLTSPGNRKYSADNSSGCSRTNPIEWSCPINVKKEPGSTPCQVAEVTTSASPIVKVEITSPTQKCPDVHGVALPSGVVTSNGNIPVGIAVARQRIHHQESVSSPSLPPTGLLTTVNTATQIKEVSRVHQEVDSTAGMAASTTGGVSAGGTLLQCTDERATGLAGWSMGGPPNSTLATPTLWQYPATLPVEPMLPLPALPMPPVGVQLVRDPSSGQLLLLPTTTGIEQLQQAVVWPSYQQPPSVLLPPLPPPPLQLLSSASSDFLSSSTTLHQHTQTHSTRLLAVTTTDAKRKIPLPIPTTTLIKIEADAATSTLDQTKTLQAVSTVANSTGSVYTEQNMAPLVTTHLIYQHPTNLILSQTPSATTEMACRSQATSPVACLTPPPETNNILEEEVPGVQDASNQTDTPFCSEDDNTTHAFCDVVGEAKNKQIEEPKEKIILAHSPQEVTSSTTSVEKTTQRQKILELPDEYIHDKTTDVVRSSIESETPEPISSSTNEPVVPEILEHTPPKTPEPSSEPTPDISGLELLSNSIFELENSRKNQEKPIMIKCEKKDEAKAASRLSEPEIAFIKIEKESPISQNQNQVDDSLGGLNLLCALAEQRILEEVEGQKKKMQRENLDKIKDATYWERHERKKEKRKSKKHSSDESRRKRIKTGNEHCRYKDKSSRRSKHESDSERAQRRENGERICNSDSERSHVVSSDTVAINRVPYENYYEPKCSSGFTETENCNCKDHRAYKSRKSEEEVRKYIASKSQPSFIKDDWPAMNAMELDMRLKLAELQRKYKEKQRELSKLKPKKKSSDEKSSKRRKMKKRSHSDRSITPPPLLDKIDSSVKFNRNPSELLRPPTLCAIEPTENLKIEHHSTPIKHLDTSPFSYRFECSKRTYSPDLSDTTPEKVSSSKKRKVGRPKKLMSSSGLRTATETIVAKKPKKGTFVGYLLAAKEKFQMQNKPDLLYCNSPPRYVEDNKKKLNKYRTNNNIMMCNGVDDQAEKSCKIRPKLKAEPTIKEHAEDEEEIEEEDGDGSEWEDEDDTNEMEEISENKDDEDQDMEIDGQKDEEQLLEQVAEPPKVENQPFPQKSPESTENEVTNNSKKQDDRCILTTEHLKIDKLRVLTVMAGLFYAGHLNAIEPPDVYSITLDGERGNRPHIMSREEILRDAIVEISPSSTEELPVGTRLCAYWSQQYRCLYPGSVAEPGTPDPVLDSKFVAVEFDDGDSGRIALEDIRLLPPDYPIMEYDPNPLLSLSKRRRRTSVNSITNEERRLSQCISVTVPPLPNNKAPKSKHNEHEKENKDLNKQDVESIHKERKRLKKKKKDKIKQKLIHEDKKKKKKHRFCDEHCKHKKHHKKHRKHKKHHHSKESSEERSLKEMNDNEAEEEVQVGEVISTVEEPPQVFPPEPEIVEEDETEADVTSEEQEDPENFDEFPEYQVINPDDEVTMDDIIESKRKKKSKKIRDRQESCESRSKMTAFLPARQLWSWSGKGYKRPKAKGRSRKQFFKAIQRGKEIIMVGDSAVFLSTGRPDRPYIGKIEAMWETCGTMVVRVKWFYHPEETAGCPLNLLYPGALFESPHIDENDVQTISHKCDVLPLNDYREKLGDDPKRYATIYDNNDIYYLAGYYDPSSTTLKMEPGIPFKSSE